MVVTYAHVYYRILRDPGLLPLGQRRLEDDEKKQNEKNRKKSLRKHQGKSALQADAEKVARSDVDVERGSPVMSRDSLGQSDFGLEEFYSKDVFVCQDDGKPPWCTSCAQFKTDRAHHCRELGRCVRKMDHFCPWYETYTSSSYQNMYANRQQGWWCGVRDIIEILHSVLFLY